MSETVTVHQADQQRYEAHLDGELAGFAAYVLGKEGGVETIVFTHTEVGDEFGGKGVGSTLARAALDDVRAGGQLRVVARCPFIKAWIEKHPDYQDLLA